MISKVRYQVFVSSTYDDLREERQQATQSILEAECFPSGMELFPASNDTQWELIKRVIEESDYYIVIVGGRYGSLGPSGLSYTEMEYDYAISIGTPVLGFVRKDPENIASKFAEKSAEGQTKLERFREKVLSRTCRHFSEPKDLGMAVLKSLMQEARIRPRIGWVKADQARSKEEIDREIQLQKELSEAREEIDHLDRQLRDRDTLSQEIEPSELASGDDLFGFSVIYKGNDKKTVQESVYLSWNEILATIGPMMYGFVIAHPMSRYEYTIETALQHKIRSKIVDKAGTRVLSLSESDVNACIFHLKELGFVQFRETERDDGSKFRGISLTKQGEVELSRVLVSKKGG